MIWFFERPGERLQCEVRIAAAGTGFELVWTAGDGRIRIERFDNLDDLQRRQRALEYWLKLDGWVRPGSVPPPRRPVSRPATPRKLEADIATRGSH